MADRQTRNVSLPPHQDEFIDGLVAAGKYRTASEVVREGLRLLEEVEHRRHLEAWITGGSSKDGEPNLPAAQRSQVRAWFERLVQVAIRDVEAGRVEDGDAVMKRLKSRLEAKRR